MEIKESLNLNRSNFPYLFICNEESHNGLDCFGFISFQPLFVILPHIVFIHIYYIHMICFALV